MEKEKKNSSDYMERLEQPEQPKRPKQKPNDYWGEYASLESDPEFGPEEDVSSIMKDTIELPLDNMVEEGEFSEDDLPEKEEILKYQALCDKNNEQDVLAKYSFDILPDVQLSEEFEDVDTSGETESIREFSATLLGANFSTAEDIGKIISGDKYNQSTPRIQKKVTQQGKDSSVYQYAKEVMSKNKLCYLDTDVDNKLLSVYNGKCWQRLTDDDLKQLAYEILPESMKKTTNGIEALVTNIANFVKRDEMQQYHVGKKRFSEEDYKKIQNHIVFNNCVYDIENDRKRKHTHKRPYYFAVDCDYIDGDLDTPFYDKFKRDATGGDEESMNMFDYMQAYLVIPNRTGKCFFVMAYAKDSGKTSFGEFIEGYFQYANVSKMDTDFVGGKFSYAGLDRAVMVSCLEMTKGNLSTAAIKALKNFTGESRMNVEAKYENPVTTMVRFKVLLASNGGIILPPGQTDDAFYRRAIVIPFINSRSLDELMTDLPQKWKKERAAIISKCARKLHSIIKEDGGIVFPESMLSKEIKASWTGNSFFSEKFIQEMLSFTADGGDAIAKSDLEVVYNNYYDAHADEIGISKPVKISKDELVELICALYPGVIKDRKKRLVTLGNAQKSPNPIACIIGVVWTQAAGEYLKKETE